MKKIIFLFISFLGAFSMANSQEILEKPIEKQAEGPLQLEKSLLWEISGNGLETSSFLYGTIHIIDKNDFFLTEKTKEALAASSKLTLEINMDEMTNIFSQISLLMGALMKDGATLKTLLNKEDYQVVETYFDEMGLPMFILDKVKPLFLSSLVGADMGPEGMMSGEMVSYEMEFVEMANEQEMEMGGLETAAYQMSMFDSIPYKVQADMLVESIKYGDEGVDQLAQMIEIYKSQDINALVSMIEEEEGGVGEYDEILLDGRNRNWIPVMGEMMNEQKTFFAVGAGHLGGKNGVINLLRQEGYTVKALFDEKKEELKD